MKLRKVIFYRWQRVEGQVYNEKVIDGEGLFHQFGVNYEEFENGAGNFSTAIIELADGSIINIPVDLIKFEK